MALLSACQWDPARDNPLDTGSNAYHYPFGSLRVGIQTLVGIPVRNATVVIPDLGRFLLSDDSGRVTFEEIPIGTWWVIGFRDTEGDPIYARDSLQVTIGTKELSDVTLRLDALPRFISAFAVSLATSDSATQPDADYYIRLKATVTDPDGIASLERVEALLVDSLRNYSVDVDLQYNPNPDSAFWWRDIPASAFHNGSTDNVLFLPFRFRAFDFEGKSSPPRTAFVARVLHGVPSYDDPQTDFFPHLEWTYSFYFELNDTSTFNYLVKIYRLAPELREVYNATVIPRRSAIGKHDVTVRLPNGNDYRWEVWVLDNFGNSSRSRRGPLSIGPPPI